MHHDRQCPSLTIAVFAATGPPIITQEVDVDIFETLGPFWIVGIVLNVTLTGLAIWWVISNMRTRKQEHPGPADPAERP